MHLRGGAVGRDNTAVLRLRSALACGLRRCSSASCRMALMLWLGLATVLHWTAPGLQATVGLLCAIIIILGTHQFSYHLLQGGRSGLSTQR